MRKPDNDVGTPVRQGSSFRWARLLAGVEQLALYLSLLALLWVIPVAIGLALFRKNEHDYLVNVYKPLP